MQFYGVLLEPASKTGAWHAFQWLRQFPFSGSWIVCFHAHAHKNSLSKQRGALTVVFVMKLAVLLVFQIS